LADRAAGKLRLSAIVASGFARASLFRFVVERSRNDGNGTTISANPRD
jgi:hypothetical protein